MGSCPTKLKPKSFALFAAKSSFLRALRVLRGEYSSTLNPEDPSYLTFTMTHPSAVNKGEYPSQGRHPTYYQKATEGGKRRSGQRGVILKGSTDSHVGNMANAVSTTKPFQTTKDTARQSRNQRRKSKFYHEGHEEHEVKKFKNITVRNLRGLRVLRGEIVFLIQEVRNDASENLRRP